MKKGKFKVEIYGFTVNVVIVEDADAVVKFYKNLRKRLKLKPEKLGRSAGLVFTHNFDAWIIFAETELCYNLVVHECAHLTFQILNYNNIEVKRDNEYFASLAGYIGEKVFNTINYWELNIK